MDPTRLELTLPRAAGTARVARRAPERDHGAVPAWGSFSYVFGPLFAAGLIGLFVLILRWAFSRGTSVVAAAPRPGADDEYGLLVPVASPPTYIEGEVMRRRLEDSGVRANLATTTDGPRVMVWPSDEARARDLLASDR